MTIICCSIPVPAGLFTPIFLLGGMIGRLYGELVSANIADIGGSEPTQFTPAEFAVLGGAAMAGGTFRAVSTVVIVTELTGQLHIQLPVAVCVITAYYITNRFAAPMYDVLTVAHSVPHLPALSDELSASRVSFIMKPFDTIKCLTEEYSLKDVVQLLDSSEEMVFPVVRDKTNRILMGEVSRRELERAIEKVSFKIQKERKHSTSSINSDIPRTMSSDPSEIPHISLTSSQSQESNNSELELVTKQNEGKERACMFSNSYFLPSFFFHRKFCT